MKKSVIYLLLAMGITIAVLLVCGALIGFAAGFIDGWNEAHQGTTSPVDLMSALSVVVVVILGGVLHWVFLHYGFASYTLGRIPRAVWWRFVPLLLLVMGGLAVVQPLLFNPLGETVDSSVRDYYLWMKHHPLSALFRGCIIEATANLVIYGAVLREILEWRHRPELVIPVFAGVVGLLTGLFSGVAMAIPSVLCILVEASVYEYSRSVVPILIGDMFFWVVVWCLLGHTLPWWCLLVTLAVILPSACLLLKVMDPYKPID